MNFESSPVLCVIMILWSSIGFAVCMTHMIEAASNYKQYIFLYVTGGPIVWIFVPIALIAVAIATGITKIYNLLAD